VTFSELNGLCSLNSVFSPVGLCLVFCLVPFGDNCVKTNIQCSSGTLVSGDMMFMPIFMGVL